MEIGAADTFFFLPRDLPLYVDDRVMVPDCILEVESPNKDRAPNLMH